ncbi:hypothetical protein ACKKBF_B12795 [Auxenochlorella protothecoides x Auxenochlorella symbiontica]
MLAQQLARDMSSNEVGTDHLILGLIAEASNKPSAGSLATHVQLEDAKAAVKGMHSRSRRRPPPNELHFTRDARRVFSVALQESQRMGMSFVTPDHLVLGMVGCRDDAALRLLRALRLDPRRMVAEALGRLRDQAVEEGTQRARRGVEAAMAPAGAGRAAPGPAPEHPGAGERGKVLDTYCRDLTAAALAGRIDPVFCREAEIARLMQVLARRRKSCPVLLGEAGVGKTAIVEGLARCIATGSGGLAGQPLPLFLKGMRVLSLDLARLMAGTRERGELEARLTGLVAEAGAAPDVILFVDEIHQLVGGGAALAGRGGMGGGGGPDLAALFKPALARGRLRCVGATTEREFRRHFERDPALERRFQPVWVEAPDAAATLGMLRGSRPAYEAHHRCLYTDASLVAAVALAGRHLPARPFPDSALDVLDEAGSLVRVLKHRARRARCEEETEARAAAHAGYLEVLATARDCAAAGHYEEAGLLARRRGELEARLGGEARRDPVLPRVTPEHVARVVSAATGVPFEELVLAEGGAGAGGEVAAGAGGEVGAGTSGAGGLLQHLRDRIVGQDAACQAAARALTRSGAGLRDPGRPQAGLLFVGPPGCGKGLLAEALGERRFGGSVLRLDMSECGQRHSVSRLLGAPPGYQGYDNGGTLTEPVRRRPHSLVILDSIEKAHPHVLNLLLQILEDGRLADGSGRQVSFRQTVVILISTSHEASGRGGLGFEPAPASQAEAEAAAAQRARREILDSLKERFPPELLNRLDDIVVFERLAPQHLHAIAELEIAALARRLEPLGILGLTASAELRAFLAREACADGRGARGLRTLVSGLLADAVADALLTGQVSRGQGVHLTLVADGQVGVQSLPAAAAPLENNVVPAAPTAGSVPSVERRADRGQDAWTPA